MMTDKEKKINDELNTLLLILHRMKIDLNMCFSIVADQRKETIDQVCKIKRILKMNNQNL